MTKAPQIFDIASMPSEPMGNGRGTKIKLIDTRHGTEKVDVHLNTLIPGGPRGPMHRHSKADNVYIVRRGKGEMIVEGKTYVLEKDQVVFIPAGLVHSLSNVSDETFEIFEIYAPAGKDFDFIAS